CRAFHDLLPLDGMLFLVMPKEPIIELCEAGDSGECLLGHVMIVGEKCVAHLGLTNGFRMVVDEGPEGGHLTGQVPNAFAPQDLLVVYKLPLNGFHLFPVNLGAFN
ncbi:hypothetical protein Nmel_006491, partial [Mimus melanotis]